MKTLQYRISNCIDQAKSIKNEYPNVDYVSFDLTECSYGEMKVVAEMNNRKVEIVNGCGDLRLVFPGAFVSIKSKPLLISEPVIVEG